MRTEIEKEEEKMTLDVAREWVLNRVVTEDRTTFKQAVEGAEPTTWDHHKVLKDGRIWKKEVWVR